jgi:uncharacterized protein (TIGR02996 family)
MSRDIRKGFMEDICANVDDDAPRLIFADWLDENGEPERAEFIRVQIARTRLPEWEAAWVRLRLREEALLKLHEKKWRIGLPRVEGVTWRGFRRGFLAEADITGFTTLRAGFPECRASFPVERITTPWPRKAEKCATIPLIPGLRELCISSHLHDEREAAYLADAPLLETLRALYILGNRSEAGYRRLLSSPHLGGLRVLRIPNHPLGNAAITALREASTLVSLEEVDLSEYGVYGRGAGDPIINAEGMEALAQWDGLARLSSLDLQGNDIRRAGLQALLGSPHLTKMKSLTLRATRLDGAALHELCEYRGGMRLDLLDLSANILVGSGMKDLAAASCLASLKVLRLDECEIQPDSALDLGGAGFFGTLRRLHACNNAFGPAGLREILAASPPLLHTLDLENNAVSHEGVVDLANSPASDSLLDLGLDGNRLKGKSAKALAETKHLRNLLVLRLLENNLGVRGTAALAGSPLARRLARLDMDDMD